MGGARPKILTTNTHVPNTSKMIYDSPFRIWSPETSAEFDNGPCAGRSCYMTAHTHMEDGLFFWECACGSWVIPRQRKISHELKHSADECGGYCAEHCLLTASALELRDAMDNGVPWGDIMLADEAAMLARLTPAQMATREAEAAAYEAAGERELQDFRVGKKAEKWGKLKCRVPRPCKYITLFMKRECAGCGAKVPEGQTQCSAKKGYRVCGEKLSGCWMHEQGKCCLYIHPDEPQWAAALSGDLCFDRQQQCFHLRGEHVEVAAPKPKNRFVEAATGAKKPTIQKKPRGEDRSAW